MSSELMFVKARSRCPSSLKSSVDDKLRTNTRRVIHRRREAAVSITEVNRDVVAVSVRRGNVKMSIFVEVARGD